MMCAGIQMELVKHRHNHHMCIVYLKGYENDNSKNKTNKKKKKEE